MSSIESPNPPLPSSSLRPLPPWAWALTVLVFPAGGFVALGSARALSWTCAVLLAVISTGTTIGFVQLMVYLESHEANNLVRGLANLAGVAMFWGWGFLIYRIGLRKGLWSPVARQCWRVFGWVIGGILMLSALLNGVLAVLALLQERSGG